MEDTKTVTELLVVNIDTDPYKTGEVLVFPRISFHCAKCGTGVFAQNLRLTYRYFNNITQRDVFEFENDMKCVVCGDISKYVDLKRKPTTNRELFCGNHT